MERQNGPFASGRGGSWTLGAEGVGQALWEGTPERGCEESWSREVLRLSFRCERQRRPG